LISNIQGVDLTQNASITAIQGVDNTQNTWISANAVYTQAAFGVANNASANTIVTQGVDATQNTLISIIQGVDLTQNTLITNIQNVDTTQNTWISANAVYTQAAFGVANNASANTIVTQGVDATQNTLISIIQAVDLTQNTSISIIQGVDLTQNTWISSNAAYTQAAFNQANTDVTNISITPGTYGNSTIIPVITVAANGRITAVSNVNASGTGGGGGVSASGYLANSIIFANTTGYLSNVSNLQFVNSKTLTVTGLISANYIGYAGSQEIALTVAAANSKGGIGYGDFLQATNASGGATNPNKFFRLNSIGNIEIINSAYTGQIFVLTDTGSLTVPNFALTNGGGGAITFADGTTQATAASGAATDQAARNLANTATSTAQAAFNTANSASANTIIIQGVDLTQNTLITNIQNVDTTQNTWISSNAAYTQAAFNVANNASSNTIIIQGVDLTQNTLISNIQGVDLTQNASITAIQGVDLTQNTNIQSAWNTANVGSNFVNTGGTITGNVTITRDVTIQGNLSVLGNSTTIYTGTLETNDSLIYLANNNYVSDVIDIGFIGHYNATGNAHTGLFRDPNLKEYIFFQGYTPEVQSNNVINIADPSFAYANVYSSYFKGNLVANTVVINGTNILNYTQAAFNVANNASSNTIITQGVDATQNTLITNIQGVDSTQNTLITNIQGVDSTQNTWISANAAYTQAAFNQANTDVTNISVAAGTYGSATLVPVITITANGRISAVTNTTITASGGGGTTSGYLANTVFVANTGGYLSNSTMTFYASNNTLYTSNTYVTNRIGFANTTTGVSVVYQYYNATTNSLDTVFG
jgi:hypothetical protein